MNTEKQPSSGLSRWLNWLLLALVISLVCIYFFTRKKADTTPAGSDASENRRITVNGKEMVMGKRPEGNCSISGKVIAEATGKPVRNARMYLHYNVTPGAIFVNTDADGAFTIKDISTGPYSLQMMYTPVYQDVPYNPENKPGQFPSFSLKDGEHRSDIVLKAKQAYRISGKIRDENGKTPKNINTLTVVAWIKKDGDKNYSTMHAQVDRRTGSYRIGGLDGKPAYVMAIDWQAAQKGNAYPPIYYPGVFSRNDAKQITFGDNQRTDNIDITLKKEGGLIIEGTVLDEAGKPIPEAFVVVHRLDMLVDSVTAYTDAQGRYQIQGLGDGEFLVHVDAIHRGFVRTRTPVDIVGGKEKTRQDFKLTRGVAISGKFVDENGKNWRIGDSFGYSNVTEKSDWNAKKLKGGQEGGFGLTHFWNKYRCEDIKENSAGSFTLGEGDYDNEFMYFPTRTTFVLESMKPGHTMLGFLPKKERQKVVKILYDGRDIMKSGIDTKPGQEIKDVTIVIGKE